MKKPELYYMHRTYGERERVQLNMEKIAIWNSLYYRSKGRRRKYVVRETTPIDKMFRRRKYTRWQLEYDLKKPWHVSAIKRCLVCDSMFSLMNNQFLESTN